MAMKFLLNFWLKVSSDGVGEGDSGLQGPAGMTTGVNSACAGGGGMMELEMVWEVMMTGSSTSIPEVAGSFSIGSACSTTNALVGVILLSFTLGGRECEGANLLIYSMSSNLLTECPLFLTETTLFNWTLVFVFARLVEGLHSSLCLRRPIASASLRICAAWSASSN